MAIADTITSMQNHTSNAYNVLQYGTDLTGVHKNLENLKQCIFDSLINSMSNTLNTTWNNLPKITTTPSTSQSINNTIEAPMRITLSPSELSQVQTTQSANLFDEEKYKIATYETYAGYNNILTNIKGNRVLYTKCILKSGKTAINNLYMCISNQKTPNISPHIESWLVNASNTIATSYADFTGYDDIYFTYYPTTVTREDIFDAYNIMVSTDDVSYVPFVPNSPTPDYPSEIHTISGDNTIRIEGKNKLNTLTTIQSYPSNTTGDPSTPRKFTSGTYILGMASNNYYSNAVTLVSHNEDTWTFSSSLNGFGIGFPLNLQAGSYKQVRGTGSQGSLFILKYDSNGNYVSNTTSSTFTIEEGYSYLLVIISTSANTQITFSETMVVLSSETDLTYEPYNETDYSINLNGKNLFDGTFSATNKYISNDGTENNSNNFNISQYIPILPNTSYTTSGMTNSGSNPSRCYYNANKEFISGIKHNSGAYLTDTSPNNAYYMRESIPIVDINTTMINKGSTALPYEPYLGIQYCKKGNYADDLIRNSGKNLFDEELEQGTVSTSGINENSTARIRTKNYIKVEPLTQYIISYSNKSSQTPQVSISFYDKNDYTTARLSYLSWNTSNPLTFTTPANTKYIRFLFSFTNDSTINTSNIANVMLNKGTTSLDYEPYGSNEWYIKKNIGKVVLNGTENWELVSSGIFRTIGVYPSDVALRTQSPFALFSNYKYEYYASSITSSIQNNEMSWNGSKQLIARNDNYATLDNFKNSLTSNNTIVYYILATPTYTSITGTLANQLETIYNAYSKNTQTNISQINNDLSFILNTQILQNL